MPFVQVDPSQIKFDAPSASASPTGFVSVDPSQIQFDKPGFLDRLSGDISQSLNKGANLLTTADQRNPLSTALQVGSQALNATLAPATEAIKNGYEALPNAVTQPINNTVQKATDVVKSAYQGGVDELANTNAGQAFGNYGMNNPRLQAGMQEVSDDAKAAANLASIIPLNKASTVVEQGISDAAGGTQGLADKYATKYPGETPMQEITPKVAYPANPDALATASSMKYQQMRDAGASLNQNGIDLVNNSVGQALKNSGLMNERLHGDTMSVVSDLKNDAATGSLDLEKLDQYRQLLGNVVTDNTTKLEGINQDALKAQTAIGAIDDAVDSLGSSHINGGQQYTKQHLDSAIDEWDKLKELERHLTNTVNGTAEFAGKNQRGFWRQQSITSAADDAKNLANVKQQVASQESNISNIEQNLANAPQAESKAKQALDALNQARDLYAGKARLQTIQRIIDNAYMTDNPATAMRTGFRNLAKQVNVSPRGWSAEEVTAINRAAKTGIMTGALKTMGGRLMSGVVGGVGGAVGGGIPGALAGAAIGEGIGYPMRVAANALQEGRGKAVANIVMQRPEIMQALPQSVKDIMALPPAQAKAALNALRMQQLQAK